MELLLARYWPQLERFLAARAPAMVLARESGADLAQSVCREVLEHLERDAFEYQGEAEFRQWMFRAAELKLEQKRRRYAAQKRDVGREVRADGMSPSRWEHEALYRTLFTPSREAVRAEERERFEAALGDLDDQQREIIRLFHAEGLSHKEIAERLGVKESYSRTLLSRAIARLAAIARSQQLD